jgi:hypothetical protein
MNEASLQYPDFFKFTDRAVGIDGRNLNNSAPDLFSPFSMAMYCPYIDEDV